MGNGSLSRALLALAAGILLAGCGTGTRSSTAPAATPTAPAPPTPQITGRAATAEIAAPTPSPVSTATVSVPPAGTALPAPAATSEPFALGAPIGDAYDPAGVAVDSGGKRAVVYAGDSGAGGPVIAVLDLVRGEVTRLIPLRGTGYPSDGQVLLSPDGRQGYAVDGDAAVLTLFDPDTGALGPAMDGVTEALLSPSGERLYAIMGREGLRAFATTDLAAGRNAPLWSVAGAPYVEIAVNGHVLAATRGGDQPALVTFDGATGRQTGSTPLAPAGVTAALAPGPDGGWLLSSGYNPVRLARLDAGLKGTAEAEALSGADPYYDAPRGRYLIVGWADEGSAQVIMSYAEKDLAPTAVLKGAPGDVPEAFASSGEEMLLGLQRRGGARLSVLDPADLSSTREVILGVKLTDMALDEAGNRLYVADDQDRIHVLGLPGGGVQAVWDGAAPIAFVAQNAILRYGRNGLLYVNRASGVVALDSTTGEELARFPQGGMSSPDPDRDLVYITDRGVTIYDRAGTQIGRLDDTFPVESGMIPNPYAFAARVNPADGSLVAVFNNGTPGSNNRSYLRVSPLQADRPITVTGPFTFVSDLAIDSGGDLLASYSNAFNMEALQRLDNAGREKGRLGGRTGKLALDPTAGLLYVAGGGALARVDAGTMQLRDLYRGPAEVSQIVLHPGLRRLYVRSEDSSRITVLDLDELQPIDMRPVAVDGLQPDAEVGALGFLTSGDESILYATTRWEHYRARVTSGSDGSGLRWERLPVGSLAAWGEITVAGDALFRGGAGEYGGDGVFRSRDGGDSWELLSEGLTDLRPAQPVLARSAGEAYFVGRTGGIFAWRPAPAGGGTGTRGTGDEQGKWQRVLPAERDYGSPGELSLAPDGTLFLASWDRVRRSTDGGLTWSDLPVPGDGVKIVGFDPDYVHTHTVFSHLCSSEECRVLRSHDGGETQQAVLLLPPYSSAPQVLARAGRPELYLYTGGYPDPQIHRSTDGGDTWQAADSGVVQDTTSVTMAPDGRLWFGGKGSVRAVDPGTIRWTAVSSAPRLRAEPPLGTGAPASPAASPAPSPTPCAQWLPDLGCPTSPERSVAMARQSFQHGEMVWLGGGSGAGGWEKVVVVLSAADGAGRSWQRFSDMWQEGQPASDPALVPPDGLYQPVRGFGAVWRDHLGGAQAPVGWATAQEEGLTGGIQPYGSGIALRLGEDRLLLADDGTWRLER
jgi:hypothetical protein